MSEKNKISDNQQDGNDFIADVVHICSKCKKPLKGWGIDGCPTVSKGNEMGILTGMITGWTHYDCM